MNLERIKKLICHSEQKLLETCFGHLTPRPYNYFGPCCIQMRQIESVLLDITENRPHFILVSCNIQPSLKF